MTLKQFADECGVEIVRCDPSWGGTYGYRTQDRPNVTMNGFKTENSAYAGWLEGEFGSSKAGKAVQKLLKEQPNGN